MSQQQLEKYLESLSPDVKKNLKIVSTKDLGQDFLLHISPDKLSKVIFTPRIGNRQGRTEDRTVPRITVSPTLLGCHNGYALLRHSATEYMRYSEEAGQRQAGL